MKEFKENPSRGLVWASIIIIGCAYYLLTYYMPLIGDDITFANLYSDMEATWKGIPTVLNFFHDTYHPRTADMLLCVLWGVLPTWIMALINGAGTALMFAVITIAGTRKSSHTLARMLIIMLTAFTLRWDSIWMEMCTQSNCVWSAGMGIGAILLATQGDISKEHAWQWLMMPLMLIAGAMHEAQGISILAGMAAYLFTSNFVRKASRSRKAMMLALLVGAALPFTAPSLYYRASLPGDRQEIWSILLESGYYVMALVIVMIWLRIRHPRLYRHLFKSQWIIFGIGAMAGMMVMLVAGYGGRPGWFAQIYALIALARIARHFKNEMSMLAQNIASTLIFILLCAHYVGVVAWQRQLFIETHDVITMYNAAPGRPVFYDYTSDADLPPWLLRKVHGVPDADDSYYRQTIEERYGEGLPLNIFPTTAQKKLNLGKEGISKEGRYIFSSTPLPQRHRERHQGFETRIAEHEGCIYVESILRNGGDSLFVYEELDKDYGNR